jgi:KDO2-lipid IV(A) lauroyltransferase
VAALPWGALGPLGRALGWVAGGVLRIRRAHVEGAIARAGIAAPRAVASRMYGSLGTGLLELLWATGRPERPLDAVVRFSPEAVAAFEAARAHGRGVVVATAHVGNWDLVACAAAARFGPLHVVTKRLSVGALDGVWQSGRARRGVRLHPPAGALVAAAAALAGGATVALMVDQAPERGAGVRPVAFLGAPALADEVPALIALRARAPVAVVLGRRLADGSHLVEVPLVLPPPARPSRAWVATATARVQAEVERFVRAHPEQWLWMHRRWKGALRPAPDGGSLVASGADRYTPRP